MKVQSDFIVMLQIKTIFWFKLRIQKQRNGILGISIRSAIIINPQFLVIFFKVMTMLIIILLTVLKLIYITPLVTNQKCLLRQKIKTIIFGLDVLTVN